MSQSLYSAYFATDFNLSDLQKAALKVLVRNEVSDSSTKAYRITSPVSANSGYSFGPVQFDLKTSVNVRILEFRGHNT
jgi:hypothetical protein